MSNVTATKTTTTTTTMSPRVVPRDDIRAYRSIPEPLHAVNAGMDPTREVKNLTATIQRFIRNSPFRDEPDTGYVLELRCARANEEAPHTANGSRIDIRWTVNGTEQDMRMRLRSREDRHCTLLGTPKVVYQAEYVSTITGNGPRKNVLDGRKERLVFIDKWRVLVLPSHPHQEKPVLLSWYNVDEEEVHERLRLESNMNLYKRSSSSAKTKSSSITTSAKKAAMSGVPRKTQYDTEEEEEENMIRSFPTSNYGGDNETTTTTTLSTHGNHNNNGQVTYFPSTPPSRTASGGTRIAPNAPKRTKQSPGENGQSAHRKIRCMRAIDFSNAFDDGEMV